MDEQHFLSCPWGCKTNTILKDGGIDEPNQLRVWGCPHANGMRLEMWNDRKQPSDGKIDGGYFGTHCHICHEAVGICKCQKPSAGVGG